MQTSGLVVGNITTEITKQVSYVISTEYSFGDWILAAECYLSEFFATVTNTLGSEPSYETLPGLGWYLSASYRFTDWFELGLAYSEYYNNRDDKSGERYTTDLESYGTEDHEAWNKAIILSTRFDINDNWLIKLEVTTNNGTSGHNPAENPDGLEENWNLFAAKVTYNF